jgi:lysophospholipase L1-like esterase
MGWELTPNFEGPLTFDNGNNVRKYDAEGFLAYDTAQIADSKTPRIVAIGDSNTYGWGVPAEATWVEVLDRALPRANVINLGVPGYSSFQGYRRLLKHGDRLHPAVLIASFNFNDRGYVYGHNGDSEQKFAQAFDAQHSAGRRLQWVDKIYMAKVMRSVMRRVGLIRTDPPINTDIHGLDARVPPASYRENLRKIAEYGRVKGIPVIFILLKDNPYYTRQINAGIEYRQRGEYERAIRALRIGLTNQISGTLARKYLVRTYEDMGAADTAAELGKLEPQGIGIGGGHPIYTDLEYNKIMIEVAHEFGVKLVDARPMLDADPDQFVDMCHPDEVGHARIAALVLKAVKEVAPPLAEGASDLKAESTAAGATRPHD